VGEETVQMMAECAAFYVPTFISLVQRVESAAETRLPDGIVENLNRTIARGKQVYGWAQKHKVPTGFGTDLWGPDAQKSQLREFEMRQDIDTPARILRSATATNAELLMEKGTLGTIAEGAYADLLVVEGNPLADLGVDESAEEPEAHHEDGAIYRVSSPHDLTLEPAALAGHPTTSATIRRIQRGWRTSIRAPWDCRQPSSVPRNSCSRRRRARS
jgi:imidazolonepropionase-like amidohydrolase